LENARKHHVIIGAYHFFTIGDDINAQITNFTQLVKISKGDLPPVLDIESEYSDPKAYIAKLRKYGVKRMQDDAIKWLIAVESYYGIKPIIYTSEVWKKHFLADKRFDSYDFWISRYYNIEPKKENKWTFWQRTCKAVPHGYKGEIDVNIYNGNYKGFLDYRNNIHK
jgi:lysozyme